MPDSNMANVYAYAKQLAASVELPVSLRDVQRRAELILKIDEKFPNDHRTVEQWFAATGELATEFMPEVNDPAVVMAISLRLWAGCLMAAKTIALDTRDGPNTPHGRAQSMLFIDAYAVGDPVFAAGVESAPAFKRGRNQPYSFDGVTPTSVVRRFP